VNLKQAINTWGSGQNDRIDSTQAGITKSVFTQ